MQVSGFALSFKHSNKSNFHLPEKWYFSIVDVIGVLTDSLNPNNYWEMLKHGLAMEGSELVTNCNQLKMNSADGKYYKTDVADTEQIFHIKLKAAAVLSLQCSTFQ